MSKKNIYKLFSGAILSVVTVTMIWLLFSVKDAPSGARYVASFIAGLSGFSSIEMLRRSFD